MSLSIETQVALICKDGTDETLSSCQLFTSQILQGFTKDACNPLRLLYLVLGGMVARSVELGCLEILSSTACFSASRFVKFAPPIASLVGMVAEGFVSTGIPMGGGKGSFFEWGIETVHLSLVMGLSRFVSKYTHSNFLVNGMVQDSLVMGIDYAFEAGNLRETQNINSVERAVQARAVAFQIRISGEICHQIPFVRNQRAIFDFKKAISNSGSPTHSPKYWRPHFSFGREMATPERMILNESILVEERRTDLQKKPLRLFTTGSSGERKPLDRRANADRKSSDSIRVLVTYQLHPETVAHLGKEVLYAPHIGFISDVKSEKMNIEQWRAHTMKMQEELAQLLQKHRPEVLVVGSNHVSGKALSVWREAVGKEISLSVIRRGTETGNIYPGALAEFGIQVMNTPGINSPYVAEHIVRTLGIGALNLHGKAAIIGAGAIGMRVALQAQRSGLKVYLWTPSIARILKVQNIHDYPSEILSPDFFYRPTISETLAGATHVAISVPWKVSGGLNSGLMGEQEIRQIADHASVSSVSNPGIFSPAALDLMASKVQSGTLSVRIDTGIEYAIDAGKRYPGIEIKHDQAFADPDCQRELDIAVFELVQQGRRLAKVG